MLFRSLLATLIGAASVVSAHRTGFVYTDGEKFVVDKQKFHYFGSNAYWFSFLSVCPTYQPSIYLPLTLLLQNISDVSLAMDEAKVGFSTWPWSIATYAYDHI